MGLSCYYISKDVEGVLLSVFFCYLYKDSLALDFLVSLVSLFCFLQSDIFPYIFLFFNFVFIISQMFKKLPYPILIDQRRRFFEIDEKDLEIPINWQE